MIRRPLVSLSDGLHSEPPVDAGQLASLDRVLEVRFGLLADQRQMKALRRAVARRARIRAWPSVDAYVCWLLKCQDQEELTALVSMVVVQKTSFFRDRQQFDAFENVLLPALLARRTGQNEPLRVWSAGCASGEEAYSIAISLLRALEVGKPGQRGSATVLATDISQPALTESGLGCYDPGVDKVLEDRDRPYFVSRGGKLCLRDDVRTLVSFQLHNLMSNTYPAPPTGRWDFIFCRNVLIYFSRESVGEIARRLYQALAPDGVLLIGSSESLFQVSNQFQVEEIDAPDSVKRFAYRKLSGAAPGLRAKITSKRQPKKKSKPTSLPPSAPSAIGVRLVPTARSNAVARVLRHVRQCLDQAALDEAHRVLFALTVSHPQALEPYLWLGEIAEDRGCNEEAVSWYHAASLIHPLSTQVHFLLGVALHQQGYDLPAGEEIRKALFLESEFVLGHYFLGLLAERQGDLDTALRSYRTALTLSGEGEIDCSLLRRFASTLEALRSSIQMRLQAIQQTT